MNQSRIESGISLFLLFFVTSLAEALLLPLTTMSIITCVIGIILIPILWRPVFGIHLAEDLSNKWVYNLLSVFYALFVVALALAGASFMEQTLYHVLGNEGYLLKEWTEYRYLSKELSLISHMEHWPVLLKKWAGAIMAFITALFTELLFRCFIMQSNLSNGHTALSSNIRQAALFTLFSTGYTSWLIVKAYIMHGYRTTFIVGSVCILANAFCMFLFGFALGTLRFGFGSPWGCLIIMFGYELYIGFVHSKQFLPTLLHNFTGILHSCGFCLVVFLAALPWMKKLEEDPIE